MSSLQSVIPAKAVDFVNGQLSSLGFMNCVETIKRLDSKPDDFGFDGQCLSLGYFVVSVSDQCFQVTDCDELGNSRHRTIVDDETEETLAAWFAVIGMLGGQKISFDTMTGPIFIGIDANTGAITLTTRKGTMSIFVNAIRFAYALMSWNRETTMIQEQLPFLSADAREVLLSGSMAEVATGPIRRIAENN